ncbi:hypothetical protein A3K86_09650 [Photobacterium jeanii]|uniref:OmpA-like domain-containing protein n=1 Tax=Photobacterium jeanii TaxID=858640 RepID=A0A178KHJ1_9GAMM|nr:OmpA family protein [Photobacterium jeanii]OAN16701.1 hypothetical protein A3K86_09650 [Photobacterium jeanii]PST87430.1 OmpA family protein [Photobacterium jeanii]
MLVIFRAILALFLFVSCSVSAKVINWSSALDDSSWHFSGSKTSCVLSHPVHQFGTVKIISEAGEKTRLLLNSTKVKTLNNVVNIESISPPWLKNSEVELYPYRYGYISPSDNSLIVNDVENVVNELNNGRWVAINLTDKRQINNTVIVQNINIEQSVSDYLQCQNQLIAFNYQQIRDSVFYFKPGSTHLNPQVIKKLEGIAEYIDIDSKVRKVLIDGYSDQSGQFSSKMRISRQRADEVAAMLMELGVPHQLIQIRSHGDRYLASSLTTPQALQLNRRVTVRLVRKSGASS